MINKIYFQSISQITEYIVSLNEAEQIVVAPSPEIADFIRTSFQTNEGTNNLDVITFSNFLNTLKKNFSSLDEQVIYRKSQQILTLGAAYRKLNSSPHISFTSFENCYTILTDLKSYSTNYEVLENVLENYSDETKDYVLKLFMLQNNLNLIDEHQALFELSECIRSEIPFEYKQAKNFHLIGFEHISPVQIDFFRSLSLRSKLSFFIPQFVKQNSINSDWFNWLDGDEEFLPLSEIDTSLIRFCKVNQIDYVKKINQTENGDKLFIAGKNTDPAIFDIFGKKQKNYRKKINLFDGQINDLKIIFLNLVTNHELSLSQFLDNIVELSQKSIKEKKYLSVKILSEFHRVARDWGEYFSEEELIKKFELDLFEEIVRLDLPRLYDIEVQEGETFGKVELLGSFSASNGQGTVTYFGPNSLSKGNSVNHLGKVYSLLSSLGPIQRPELSNYFTLSGISSLFSNNFSKSTIFIDEKLDKETDITESLIDIIGEEFQYEEILLEKKEIPLPNKLERVDIPQKILKRTHSANSLQTYLDCPQQYYLKYRIGSFQPLEIENQLNPFEIGRLLHFIVELYFANEFNQQGNKDIQSFIEMEIEKYFEKNKKNFSASFNQDLKSELSYKAKKMILFIQKTLIQMKIKHWSTEYSLSNETSSFKGSIDFLAYNDDTVVILDLKSSVGTKYSKKNILDFNHIQLWIYLLSMQEFIGDRNILFGYFGFRDITSSTAFFVNKNNRMNSVEGLLSEEMIDTTKLTIEKLTSEDFQDLMKDFDAYQMKISEQIELDQRFIPLPTNKSVCEYCDFSQLCKKDGESLLW
ncbi:PD-(D/E)XK nuclease family protein [Bacteriovoracaceae bacterium]|nr:PD-(D/E)XK nuclease family protein [Bacteriovoracaceae bacterium]